LNSRNSLHAITMKHMREGGKGGKQRSAGRVTYSFSKGLERAGPAPKAKLPVRAPQKVEDEESDLSAEFDAWAENESKSREPERPPKNPKPPVKGKGVKGKGAAKKEVIAPAKEKSNSSDEFDAWAQEESQKRDAAKPPPPPVGAKKGVRPGAKKPKPAGKSSAPRSDAEPKSAPKRALKSSTQRSDTDPPAAKRARVDAPAGTGLRRERDHGELWAIMWPRLKGEIARLDQDTTAMIAALSKVDCLEKLRPLHAEGMVRAVCHDQNAMQDLHTHFPKPLLDDDINLFLHAAAVHKGRFTPKEAEDFFKNGKDADFQSKKKALQIYKKHYEHYSNSTEPTSVMKVFRHLVPDMKSKGGALVWDALDNMELRKEKGVFPALAAVAGLLSYATVLR